MNLKFYNEYIEAKVEATDWRLRCEFASKDLESYKESYDKKFDEYIKLLGDHAGMVARNLFLETDKSILEARVLKLEREIDSLKKANKPDKRTPDARLRGRVIERDGYTCRYCECDIEPGHEHIDHVYPYSRGGVTALGNLVVSCKHCNVNKGDRLGIYPTTYNGDK